MAFARRASISIRCLYNQDGANSRLYSTCFRQFFIKALFDVCSTGFGQIKGDIVYNVPFMLHLLSLRPYKRICESK